MERLYVLDFERARMGGGEILREMRAAVGRAKRGMGGDCRLTGVALGRQGERLLFSFRLGRK